MPDNSGSDFIKNVEEVILEHISDEKYGVSELATDVNMSRSNLLRKIKKETHLSASQFIREIRLKHGREMLKSTSLTVSEVAYQVGFSSPSYFIKCFREYYGHPPGELGKIEVTPTETGSVEITSRQSKKTQLIVGGLLLFVVLILGFLFYSKRQVSSPKPIGKSIAVLPFKNDSNDSSNLYFVNGLMESALGNLQKIKDLRVVSRTSVEKYRNSHMGIREIAEELNVNYVVEGSGQKVGDQVMLNIQLIEATTDRHLWAEQYNRKVEDVFKIQNEIAINMVNAIKVIVTPQELEQIEKPLTENLEAYDFYLQALGPYNERNTEGLLKAIPLFQKAIDLDPGFAAAYANLAIAHYYLDAFHEEKQYTEQINNFADKALLYDAQLALSLIAKALYYRHIEEYDLALPHLVKAFDYNPNSTTVVQMLAEHYALFNPNTAKYLEYALKGIQIDIAANDSSSQSYIYLHLSNALVQAGFVEEAIYYADLSLSYFPQNYYAPYARAFMIYARDYDLKKTRNQLIDLWRNDTTRLDILQEIGKLYYFDRQYDSAFHYYEKFIERRETLGLSIYAQEDHKIGRVYEMVGLQERAEEYYDSFSEYCEQDGSIYKSASMAVKYVQEQKYDEAIEQLKIFATKDNVQYWLILFYEMDPMIDPLKDHPEFPSVMQKIKDRFWKNHKKLKQTLEDKGLI